MTLEAVSSAIASSYLTLGEDAIRTSGVTRSHPWRHFVLDGFLRDEWYRRFAAEVYSNGPTFQTKKGDPYKVQFALLDDLELAQVFLSVGFAELLRRLTGRWACVTERNAIQIRRAEVSTPVFPVHHDSGGPPSVVAIYYVSTSWALAEGGRLRLHPRYDAEPTVVVEPKPNRLVIFETKDTHWHSVEKTMSGTRYSILTEWLFL